MHWNYAFRMYVKNKQRKECRLRVCKLSIGKWVASKNICKSALPEFIFLFKNEETTLRHYKERIRILSCVNKIEKTQVIFNSQCCKNLTKLSVTYHINHKTWISKLIINKQIIKCNVLFVENCAAYKVTLRLNHIQTTNKMES